MIWIYRPDRMNKVVLDCLYTTKDRNFRDVQKDKDEAYQYKVELIKEKLAKPPKHKVLDYWRW